MVTGTNTFGVGPVFSPDGQWLAFVAPGRGRGNVIRAQLEKTSVTGGTPVQLQDLPVIPQDISWPEEDEIVVALPRGIMSVSANGGRAETLLETGGRTAGQATLLPGGDAVLMSDRESGQVEIWRLGAEAPTDLFPGSSPRYLPTGHLIYTQNGVLFAVPFDLKTLAVNGGAVPMVQGISGGRQFDVSKSGNLIWVPGPPGGEETNRVLGMVDRDGKVETLDLPPAQYSSPRLSPDGERLAVEILGANGQSNIWIADLAGRFQMQQLTRGGNNTRPVWTPDGQRVTFASDREGHGIWWQNADFSGVAERLTSAEDNVEHWPESWDPAGKILAFTTATLPTGAQSLGISTHSPPQRRNDGLLRLARQ